MARNANTGKVDGLRTFYGTDSAGRNYKYGEETWRDGTKHGLTTQWRENGGDGVAVTDIDHFTRWHENGKTASETIYGKDGFIISPYYRNGQAMALWEDDRKGRKIAEKSWTIKGEEEIQKER